MRKWAFLLMFLLLPGLAKLIIINSNDWRFVLLTMEYAHYQEGDTIFLLSESQADLIAKNLVAGSGIEIFEDRNPIVDDYDHYLRTIYGIEAEKKEFKGYSDLQDYLLKVLSPKTLFIASNIEPENTLVSIPFAYKENGIVLFPSSSLFSRISDFTKIYVIGGIARDYRNEITSIASLLNKPLEVLDRGSPYSNSLALLDKWGQTDKLYVSTGEFLEPTLLDGSYPLILTGADGYSSGFIEILRNVQVETVYVIGTELMTVARRIREDSNKEIGVIVKYGETYMSAGSEGIPMALSVYQVPLPQPNVTIKNVLYDPEDKKLYVNYRNYGDGLAYVSALTRIGKDGSTLTTLSEEEVFLLWPGDESVQVYSIDLTDFGLQDLEANVIAKFGRYTDFLVYSIDEVYPVTVTKVMDDSNVAIERATYDGSLLRIYVKNQGAVDAYVGGQITLSLNEDDENFPLTGVLVASDKTGVLKLKIKLNEDELDDNTFIDVLVKYGERQELLVNVVNQRVQLEILKVRLELLAMPVLALLLIVFLTTIVTRMKNRRYYRAGRRISSVKRNMLAPTSSRRKRSSRSSYSRKPKRPRMLS